MLPVTLMLVVSFAARFMPWKRELFISPCTVICAASGAPMRILFISPADVRA